MTLVFLLFCCFLQLFVCFVWSTCCHHSCFLLALFRLGQSRHNLINAQQHAGSLECTHTREHTDQTRQQHKKTTAHNHGHAPTSTAVLMVCTFTAYGSHTPDMSAMTPLTPSMPREGFLPPTFFAWNTKEHKGTQISEE